jgi:hypothetical protein
MQLRFAKRPAPPPNEAEIVEGHEHTCRWCGFVAASGHRAYVEEDGAETVACDACFNARHALDADPSLYRPVWADEISQPDLAHLARVVALVQVRLRKIDPDDRRQRPEVVRLGQKRADAVKLFRELRGRADALDARFKEHFGKGAIDAWPELDEAARAALAGELRLLPIAVSPDAVTGWLTDDGSLIGYGNDVLAQHDWFVADIGLKPSLPQVPGGGSTAGATLVDQVLNSLVEEE